MEQLEREQLHRRVSGAIRDAINAHPPVLRKQLQPIIGSISKRIVGQLAAEYEIKRKD